ncbi:MAG: hypothetical protein LBL96_04370 [Clostridiales bacterium]|nr:hypothetical protein [Clostridiales bacterium]
MLSAEAAVKADNRDRFLTTDPQYAIAAPCKDFIKIEFRLRVMSLFDAEQNIYCYSHYMRDQLGTISVELDNAIADRNSTISKLDSALAERDSAIAKLDSVLAERDSILGSTSWKLTAPLRTIMNLFRKVVGGNR